MCVTAIFVGSPLRLNGEQNQINNAPEAKKKGKIIMKKKKKKTDLIQDVVCKFVHLRIKLLHKVKKF